jgi:hypothetical protein
LLETALCRLQQDELRLFGAILDVVLSEQRQPPDQGEIRARRIKLPYFCLRSPLSMIIVT